MWFALFVFWQELELLTVPEGEGQLPGECIFFFNLDTNVVLSLKYLLETLRVNKKFFISSRTYLELSNDQLNVISREEGLGLLTLFTSKNSMMIKMFCHVSFSSLSVTRY